MREYKYDEFKTLGEKMNSIIVDNPFAVISDLRKLMSTRKIEDGHWTRLSTKGDFELCDYGAGIYSISLRVYGYGAGLVNNRTAIQYCANLHVGNLDDMSWDAASPYTDSKEDCVKLIEEVAPIILDKLAVMPSSDELNEMLRPYGMFGNFEG